MKKIGSYCNSLNIHTNLLFISWQVYGNKITVNVNVLIIICDLFSHWITVVELLACRTRTLKRQGSVLHVTRMCCVLGDLLGAIACTQTQTRKGKFPIAKQLFGMNICARGKTFCKTSFQVGMDLQIVQKQSRDENTQEDYTTTEQWRKSQSCGHVQEQFFASQLVIACSTHLHSSKYAMMLQTSTSHLCTIAFSAGLNGTVVHVLLK